MISMENKCFITFCQPVRPVCEISYASMYICIVAFYKNIGTIRFVSFYLYTCCFYSRILHLDFSILQRKYEACIVNVHI